jgi:CHASE2 domain-containing sensor protein
MHAETQDTMRIALRQAGAITAVDGQYSIRQRLRLAHHLYDAMLRLHPDERARRIRLIDAMFTPASQRL